MLKKRFEAAGFKIDDNRVFDEEGVRFEIDGFDAAHRVGYEYVTEDAGDSWDVDEAVIAAIEERRRRGDLHVLIIDEADAPDAVALSAAADAFLAELRELGVGPQELAAPIADAAESSHDAPPIAEVDDGGTERPAAASRKPARAATKPKPAKPKPAKPKSKPPPTPAKKKRAER